MHIGYVEILLIAIAMSVDAFSVAFGVGCRFSTLRHYFRLSWHFGLFQFLMPLIGYGLGRAMTKFVPGMNIVAAVILFWIAYNMVMEARKGGQACGIADPTKGMKLVALSLATSMDALGVGISFAVVDSPMLAAAVVIGVVCLVATIIGTWLGSLSSRFVGGQAGYLGALVLAGIGIKFLVL